MSILRLGFKKKTIWYYTLLDEEVLCPKCSIKMEYIKAREQYSSYRHGVFRCSKCSFELVKGYTHWEEVQLMVTLMIFGFVALLWFMIISILLPDVRYSVLGL